MATVTARALEVGFRHLDVPVRWWEGPESVLVEGSEFIRRKDVEVTDAPTWSIADPGGFGFTYLLDDVAEATEFFKHSVSSVPVKLFRLYRSGDVWTEVAQWRFEGVIGSAVWDASAFRVRCACVPMSATLPLQPRAQVWSHRAQLGRTGGRDTGLRWMRAKRRLETVTDA